MKKPAKYSTVVLFKCRTNDIKCVEHFNKISRILDKMPDHVKCSRQNLKMSDRIGNAGQNFE